MKKFCLAILIALFGVSASGVLLAQDSVVYAQKKGEDKKKDPPGPPVVKDKEPKDKGENKDRDKNKEKPPKERKPD